MKRRPPSAIARWERSRAGSIVHAPGCRICSPSTAPTTSVRIIRRAQFCRRAGAAHPPRASPASIQAREEALAQPNRGECTRAPENRAEWYLRYRRRTAPNESDDDRDHEQDDRNDEDDFCDLDRETCDPAKAEYGRNQRNDQKRQSPTEHGSAPSLSKCAQLRATLFNKRPNAGMFRRRPVVGTVRTHLTDLRMHVLGEPVGRHVMAQPALLGLAVDHGPRGRELIADPDIVDEAGDVGV